MAMLAAVLGGVVGLVLSLTGAGGAILAVPLLVFALHLGVAQAGPVGLLAVFLAAGLGAALAWRAGTLRYRAAAVMAVAGWAASPAGLAVAHRVPDAPLTVAFAAVLVIVATRMWRQAARELKGEAPDRPACPPCRIDPATHRLHWNARCAAVMLLAGGAAGFLSGLLGVGGGFVLVPVLLAATDLPMRMVVATSTGVIALVSLAGVVAASAGGVMRWDVAWPFAGGAMAGMLLGRALASRLAGPRLQQGFAVASLGAAVAMLARAVG